MSMLKSFFELGTKKKLFNNLAISRETALCEKYMGKFPVISVSLKGINAGTYEKALDMAVQIVRGEARRFQYLLDSDRLSSYDKDDKDAFSALLREERPDGDVHSKYV